MPRPRKDELNGNTATPKPTEDPIHGVVVALAERLVRAEQDIRILSAYLAERDQLRPGGPWPRVAHLAAGGE